MCKHIVIGIFFFACYAMRPSHAQLSIANDHTASIKTDTSSKSKVSSFKKQSTPKIFSIFGGTTGLGAEYRFEIHKRLDLSFEASYFNFDRIIPFKVSGQNVFLYPIVHYLQGGIKLNYMPFIHKNGDRKPVFNPIIKTGLFFRDNSSFFARGTSDAILYVGSFELTPQEIGGMSVFLRTNKILPYAGIGFDLHLIKKIPLGIGVDGGVFYHGTPKVTLSGDGLYNRMVENEAQLNKNMAPFIWYPMIKLSMSYHFIN